MGQVRSKERITKPCDNCGASVTRLKSLDSPRWYCSHACYASSSSRSERTRANNRARHPEGTLTLICDGCGRSFSRARSRLANGLSFCSRDCRTRNRAAKAIRQITSGGYVLLFVGRDYPGATKTGHILEHRKVMQDRLGRALLPGENVHHINGERSDNRLANLELWSITQPCGQRVEDKVRWARELLDLYGDAFPG